MFKNAPTFYRKETAIRIAAELNAGFDKDGDDWRAVVYECNSEWFKVQILDENGNLVSEWGSQ